MRQVLYSLKLALFGRSKLLRSIGRSMLVDCFRRRTVLQNKDAEAAKYHWTQQIRSVPRHAAGLSTLKATIATSLNWQAAVNLVGQVYQPSQNNGSFGKSVTYSTAFANNVSGGADEFFSFQQGIVAGGSATLNFNGMTDILQRQIAIFRIKAWQIRLLSGTDDSTISPTPTATSTGTVTNIGPAVPATLDFGNGGQNLAATIANTFATGAIATATVNTAGAGFPPSAYFLVVPQETGGSGGVLTAVTNAAGSVTGLTITNAGTGYANANTVPLVPGGQYNLLTGGAHAHFDGGAAGFCPVSTTGQNIRLINMDGTNAVTFEIDTVSGSN